MQIINKNLNADLDIKRLYIGRMFDISYKCPDCGYGYEYSENRDYISYPKLNTPIKLHLYCNECSCEWNEDIIIYFNIRKV